MWACDSALTTEIVNSYQVVGSLFVQTLQNLLAAQCALSGDHLWPADATEAVIKDPNYDFIVVGAGSAGAVVANRLSEISHWKVLLVEAGGNPNLATEIPQLFYNNIDTSVDWGYKNQPQESICRGYKEKRCSWPRGKTLGGSSSVNGMFYVRGNKLDYNEWAAKGNYGWSYDEVLEYFKKSENFSDPLTEETKMYHNKGGYLNVQKPGPAHAFEEIIIKAVTELGVKELDDVNGPTQMGITRAYTTIKDGKRHSTAKAFLNVIKNRKNLHVVKNGIGPKKHLKHLNIEVKADLPVGENLQDHVFFPIYYSAPVQGSFNTLPDITKSFTEYILTNKGILSDTSPHKIIAFVNSSDPVATSPEVQFHYVVFPPHLANLLDLHAKHGLNNDIHRKFEELNENNIVIMIYNVLLKPKSTGRLILNSTNPYDHPLIFANYFQEPEDLKVLIRNAKEFILTLNDTKTFKDAGFKLTWLELEACKDLNKNTDEFLECVARELTFSLYHPCCTAKMGPSGDKTAVVDPQLRVHKTQGLRVIDASIMPSVVRGNTNAPSIMIGEKGANMIKQFYL
ncbi:unnamed protein product [Parnassius apollo]|uniref:(apollo) hypothetical protein n=1 Tax=Parnassius apollo TaxID=110799 RepID=A0A8S3XY84_PARAO|nr:unnamed protein product [Parnassius apollo]